jgi:hypothetical protein
MALSDYAGRTPATDDRELRISRVSRHHHWDTGGAVSRRCVGCDAEISLADGHVLVTLGTNADPHRQRVHLCDEGCLGEWVEE